MKKLGVLVLLLLALPGCSLLTEHRTGLVDGTLQACPQAPRCVSSEADNPRHAVAPLALSAPPQQAWPVVLQMVKSMPGTTIVDRQDAYLRAEVASPWRVYTDDLELLLRPDTGEIAVRSSARVGYYDFEVNRERVEKLRAGLAAAGVVRPAGN